MQYKKWQQWVEKKQTGEREKRRDWGVGVVYIVDPRTNIEGALDCLKAMN